jgi:tRNA1(Val) A37 N6-methylase TrmN6
MAAGNAMLNDWHGRFMAVAGDVRRPPFRSNGIFDHVMCNPPYHKPGHGHEPANPLARAANVETAGDLMDFAAAACRLVRRKGTVTLVHRADRLADVVAALADRAGDIVVIPVRPKADADAHRVVVRARAGVAGPLRLAADLTLHTADGAFTREATAILRKGSKLHR